MFEYGNIGITSPNGAVTLEGIIYIKAKTELTIKLTSCKRLNTNIPHFPNSTNKPTAFKIVAYQNNNDETIKIDILL